jgi:DNA-binding transcriptional regulator YhcF (GntR family)
MPTDIDELHFLNPDDPRPASQQIANLLRAAILTGQFVPGDRLPSQNDLAERYGVARETVKSAIRVLRDERLIVSRQGSGVFVRAQTERPVGLRPHIEAAFERTNVAIDFAGYSGETLHGALSEPLDKIRSGRLSPESVKIRILLPDLAAPMGVPSRADTGTATDDPSVRERMARISNRSTDSITDALNELAELGLTRTVSVETRVFATTPSFKLYIINGDEAFFGFYPIIKHRVTINGEATAIFDPMGKDATLFHFSSDDEDAYSDYVGQARAWFDSIWSTVAHEARI